MFKNWFKPPKPPTEIDLVLKKIKTIDVSQYKGAYSSDLSIFQINVCAATVIQYNRLLKTMVSKLEKDEMIATYQLPHKSTLVYLTEFFLDDQRRYIDIEKHLQEFLDLAATLLALFQEREQSNEKSFNTEKNLMHLQHIVSNLRNLVMETL